MKVSPDVRRRQFQFPLPCGVSQRFLAVWPPPHSAVPERLYAEGGVGCKCRVLRISRPRSRKSSKSSRITSLSASGEWRTTCPFAARSRAIDANPEVPEERLVHRAPAPDPAIGIARRPPDRGGRRARSRRPRRRSPPPSHAGDGRPRRSPTVSPAWVMTFPMYTRSARVSCMASTMSRTARCGRTLVNKLPGPSSTTSASRIASMVRGCASGDGSSHTRTQAPTPAPICVSPQTVEPSSRSAQSRTCSSVDGSTRPLIFSTRELSRTARSKLPVTSVRAARNRLPNEWPARSPSANRC